MNTQIKKPAHTKGEWEAQGNFIHSKEKDFSGRFPRITYVSGSGSDEQDEANAKRIVFAVNNLDKMLKLISNLYSYETDEKFRAQMEANAQQVTDGNVSYREALLAQAEGIINKAGKEL